MNSITSKILNILLIVCVGTCMLTVAFQMMDQKYVTETAIMSSSDDSVSFKGVYIREEEVVKYGGTGSVSYCVSDGGKLGNGSKIAEIYADENQIDIKQQINELNNELALLEKIQNPGTLRSAQPSNISVLIEEEYKSIINNREMGNILELSEQKNEFLVLLSTYQLVTDSGADLTSRISEINLKISQLEASETVPLDTIYSDRSAYFVSYADGYEEELNKGKLGSITVETLKAVKDSGPVDDNKVIGKLIDGYEWYVVGVIDNRKQKFLADEKVKIKFQSTSEIVEGVIEEIRETDDAKESIVVVRCDELTYNLVQHRTERVEMIAGEFEGIKVPRKAIRFLDVTETVTDEESGEKSTQTVNAKGVYVKLGERISFKRLDVIYEGGDYVLSSLNAGDGYLALYDDIVVEGVDANGN